MSLARRLAEHKWTVWAIILLGSVSQLAGCGSEVDSGPVQSGTTLCQNDFNVCINPIFNLSMRRSDNEVIQCASGGCHEVGAGFGGSFKIYPNSADPTELNANFIVARAFSNLVSPPNSKLLLEPLANSGGITGSHNGGDIFANSADPCYAAILNWISNQVTDPLDPVNCGSCGGPPAGCGYP